MKITMTLLMLLVLLLPNALAEEYTQMNLPEGAVARIGKGGINAVRYSPDGARLAVAGSAGIWLYDTVTYQEVAVFAGHTALITSIAFSPDGKTLASSDRDNIVLLWDTVTGEQKDTFTGVRDVAFSPDGKTLASSSWHNTVLLWDIETGELKNTLTGHTNDPDGIAFSPDGTTLATAGSDYTIRLWDAVTGEHKRTITGYTRGVYCVAFSPDGKVLAATSSDDTVRAWDTETWEMKWKSTDQMGWPEDLAFSPDGKTIASAHGRTGGKVLLWDAVTGELKGTLTTPAVDLNDVTSGRTSADVHGVAFSPDGKTLASGGDDGIVWLWDTTTWELK